MRIDIVGTVASSRVDTDNLAGVRYTDFFHLLKVDGRWLFFACLATIVVASASNRVACAQATVGAGDWDLRPDGKGTGAVPSATKASEERAAEAMRFVEEAEGGIPETSPPNGVAIEAVKAALERVERETEEEVPVSYTITFGDTWDWLELASGEWVRGRVLRMRDDRLEFQSRHLGTESVDFAKVLSIHSPNVNTYVFDRRIAATGLAIITEDKVIVETRRGTRTFPRSELEGIVQGGERERDWWSTRLRFGLTLNRGNTDQLTFEVLFNVHREDRMTRLDANYHGSFGLADGVQNVDRHLADFDTNVFFSSRWFVVPLFGQLLNDRFQNIRFRATPAAGGGLRIIESSRVDWDFQSGLGYQFLRFEDGSQSDRGNPQNDAFVPFFTQATFDLADDVDLMLSWLTNLVVTNIGNTNHTGQAVLSMGITGILRVDLAFLYLRTERPAPPQDPADPPIRRDDYQLIAGIVIELG